MVWMVQVTVEGGREGGRKVSMVKGRKGKEGVFLRARGPPPPFFLADPLPFQASRAEKPSSWESP